MIIDLYISAMIFLLLVLVAIDVQGDFFPETRKNWPFSSGILISLCSWGMAAIIPTISSILVVCYAGYLITRKLAA